MATTLAIKAGIDGLPTKTIPDDPEKFITWFKVNFLPRWAGNADVRNATAGPGILIDGNLSTNATISVNSQVAALFAQPYVLVGSPVAPAQLTDYRSIIAQAGVLSLTDGGAKSSLTVGVAANGIGNSQLRQGSAVSVIGNATGSIANVADITASADGEVLMRGGGSLSFAALPVTDLASISNNTVVGNISGGSASPAALTQTQLTSLIDLATTGASGAMPQLDGNVAHFLNGNGAFTTPAYPVGANPTSKIALAAANGTALTFMRSDASQALDVTIAPTWTGQHAFSASAGTAVTINGTANNNALVINGNAASGKSFGLAVQAGTTSADFCAQFINAAGTINYGLIYGDGHFILGYNGSGATISATAVGAVTFSGTFAINGGTPTAKPTGYGTPSGTVTASLTGSSTLTQVAGTLAALLAYLQSIGFIGA